MKSPIEYLRSMRPAEPAPPAPVVEPVDDEHAQMRRANALAGKTAELAHQLELIHRELLRSRLILSIDRDVVEGTSHVVTEYLRLKELHSGSIARDSSHGTEVARLAAAIDALQVRSWRSPSADLERERAANLALSDRLAELHVERDRLERRVFELEGRAAKPDLTAGRLP